VAAASPSDAADAAEAITFDALKKAFLALSTKPDGRDKCQAILKPYNFARLSDAKEEHYGALLEAINKAAA
jgi:hypothetical protein